MNTNESKELTQTAEEHLLKQEAIDEIKDALKQIWGSIHGTSK